MLFFFSELFLNFYHLIYEQNFTQLIRCRWRKGIDNKCVLRDGPLEKLWGGGE